MLKNAQKWPKMLKNDQTWSKNDYGYSPSNEPVNHSNDQVWRRTGSFEKLGTDCISQSDKKN